MQLQALLLATASDGRWRPGIGDPSLLGWVTVLGYAAAARLGRAAARRATRPARTAGLAARIAGPLPGLAVITAFSGARPRHSPAPAQA